MNDPSLNRPLELWGGIECTVNRVGETYFDQIARSGHDNRLEDLDRFAALGIRRLRYPVLWERVAPDRCDEYQWAWSDERLARLRDLKVAPIVGLIHHGSGPRYTDLLDPEFPAKFARYARAVAERYPWVDAYTPVNEPLTTARFSGLYGFWYPHCTDDRSFLLALFHQIKATVLAMREIRKVIPQAQLVQTDDLGKVFSTPSLQYQAEFENERRWLTYDLLCGRDLSSAIRDYFRRVDFEDVFAWCRDHPLPPDVCGFNYYLTSERFLDERVYLYPGIAAGGNGVHQYVDVEAVRVRARGIEGASSLLREAWNRFKLPLAVTEIQNGCTREEQLRWLVEVWNDCVQLREEKIDVRAATSWSLLGAFDWNTLVTQDTGFYEPGAFDLRGSEPRPTAIANTLPLLAAGRQPDHPVLETHGWWHKEDRFSHGHAFHDAGKRSRLHIIGKSDRVRPLLITGRTGTLGQAFGRICEQRGIDYHLTSRQQLDITDPASIAAALEGVDPWAVINTAGYVRVDDAESDQARCFAENTLGPTLLAEACARLTIPFATFSSDLVFDGLSATPYLEDADPKPLNVYGRSKFAAERAVLAIDSSALVIRTGAFFGPWDEYNFVTLLLRSLQDGGPVQALADSSIAPTYVPDLVNATLDLLLDEQRGILHLVNQGSATWFEFGCMAAQAAGMNPALVVPTTREEANLAARRPANAVLASRLQIMPRLESALQRYLDAVLPSLLEKTAHPPEEEIAA